MSTFDEDFLWLFRSIEYPAICLSLSYDIVALTPNAEKLFAIKKNILNKPIASLFSSLGLKIAFSEKNRNPIVCVFDDGAIIDSLNAKGILKLNWKIKPKKDASNEIVGFIIYAEEKDNIEYLTQVYKTVTGQKNLKNGSVEGYAESIKNYLENIIACMPGYVYWMDKNCIHLGCNDNDAELLGLSSREEIVGMTYEDIGRKTKWAAERVVLWKQYAMHVISTGKPKLNIEETVVLPNGKEMIAIVNLVPLFNEKKNVIGVVGISIDITDRKLMERELQITRERAEKAEKELLAKINQEVTGQELGTEKPLETYAKNIQNYLENIIACMPGEVYWMDANCVHLGCNDNSAKFMGLKSRKEIIGKTYEDLAKMSEWLAKYASSWKRDDLEVINSGKPKFNVEEGPYLLDGKEVYYLASRVPLFDDKKNVIGLVGSAVDISDRKSSERLQKEKGIFEKTSELMRMLAASIAHEIRTPLAIIGINADLLRMNADFIAAENKGKSTVGNQLDNIKYAVNLGAHIIENILTMLRTMSSKEAVQNKFQHLSITKDVEKLLEVYPFLKHEKSLVQVKLNKSKDFIYSGDKNLTQHILFNLIKNSLYAIKEAEKGEITITLEEGKENNILRFRDTALGISEKVLPKIFERFQVEKGAGGETATTGAGLGLAFCKMIMDSYGGDISCESKKGKYAEFILSFPKVRS